MTRDQINELLKKLSLRGMLANYDETMSLGLKRRQGPEQILFDLLKAEEADREARAVRYRLQQARIPIKKDLDGFQFRAPINEQQIQRLYEGSYLGELKNIVFVGGTGTGKTHLATAIFAKAVRDGSRGRFFSLIDLANQLEQEKEAGRGGRLAANLARLQVVMIDELGFLPVSKNGASLLFHLFSKLYERTCVIITTNLSFSDWPQIFGGNEKLTAALLDRFTHHCEIVQTGNESWRFKNRN